MIGGGGADKGKDAKWYPLTNLLELYAQVLHFLCYEEL